jgi:murein DD-endopeptidase MepM/ murein hydrolase activator NlpD
VNDRSPTGYAPPRDTATPSYGWYPYDNRSTGLNGYQTAGGGDPLFGAPQGTIVQDDPYATGTHPAHQPASFDPTGTWHQPDAHESYDTGRTRNWDGAAYPAYIEPEFQFDSLYEPKQYDPGPQPDLDCDRQPVPEVGSQPELNPDADLTAAPLPVTGTSLRAAPGHRARSRRRRPAKRSAMLTVAVPSVAVMGVAACAAAAVAVTEETGKGDSANTHADATSAGTVTVPAQFDQRPAAASRGANEVATRASRLQDRLHLWERQATERMRKAAEAAREEALRPKLLLPVTQHGLSAYFGQAGVNWMSVHTGVDFPVSYGTPVMAATDGTVTTRWNASYGNMAIVTAKDGTETWYCHLSSRKVRSGFVRAGEVIAYSGNSGNSTGPHLHFEVHPRGGEAVDPLRWFLGNGLDPR